MYFYRSVRSFYINVVSKMLKKFPFEDPVLQHMTFMDPKMKLGMTAQSGIYIYRHTPTESTTHPSTTYPIHKISPPTQSQMLTDLNLNMLIGLLDL